MALTIGTGTFTAGSKTVTGVVLTSGSTAFFSSGTLAFIPSSNLVVEAYTATGSTITLRDNWTGTTGSKSFTAFDTIEGLRDAVQSARVFSDQLSTALNNQSTAPDANKLVKRTATGTIKAAAAVAADEAVVRAQLGTAAYRDLIGTVSQSGGVPTGAIIQRGSNANGEFVRFADGTLICTRSVTLNLAVTGQAAANYFVSPNTYFTHPSSFISKPSESVRVEHVSYFYSAISTSGVIYPNQWSFRVSAPAASTTDLQIYLTAIGRWY